MSDAPLLDTHIWIWWIDRDRRLARPMVDYLDNLPPDRRPYLCDISLWETAMLVERRRLTFTLPLADWLEAAAHPRTVRLVGVTPRIAATVAALPSGFHRDPADRLITATCRVLDTPLISRDRRILDSRLVKRFALASARRSSDA